jgi:hypothetical protein
LFFGFSERFPAPPVIESKGKKTVPTSVYLLEKLHCIWRMSFYLINYPVAFLES